MTPLPSPRSQETIERHDRFMMRNAPRDPIVMVSGDGPFLHDADGREYLDLFAGFGGSILGHCHPDLVRAVSEQAGKLWHVGNLLHTEPQTQLAELIARHGFGGRSFFCHCGSDANEAAIKLARLYGQAHPSPQGHRYKIITAHHSFHGRLFGSMMATAQEKVRKGYEPLLEGFSHVPFNDLSAMQAACDQRTVAIMVEPIQGEGGVILPENGYLENLRRLCDERDMLLIFDEVWTGGGRTGKYFAHQHWNVEPDIMTLAKGVGGGLPVGVVCAKDPVARYFEPQVNHGVVAHGTTMGGNCLAMAAATAVFKVIERDNLLQHATNLGQRVIDRMNRFAKDNPCVKSVRGKGLFLGIELDPAAPGAWFKDAGQVVRRCLDRGLIVNGTQNTVLRLAPPLNITQDQLDSGLDAIEKCIRG